MPLRVRYAETDAAGLAHHASYVPWLEAARIEWLREAGVAYADLERDGYHLAVVELHLRYVSPARFDDELVVRSAVVSARSREVVFRYELVRDEENARQVANGTSRHLCLRHGRIAKLPEAIRAMWDNG